MEKLTLNQESSVNKLWRRTGLALLGAALLTVALKLRDKGPTTQLGGGWRELTPEEIVNPNLLYNWSEPTTDFPEEEAI